MILDMAELVLPAPIDYSIQYIFYGVGLLARGHAPWVMGPDLAHNCASQPQFC